MSKENLKNSVKINLRSVTQSRKGGVPLSQLQSDYKGLLGKDIPFKDLGYNSLEYFLRDIPDVISLKRNKEGKFVAEGVADASTAHIAKLISKQKASKSGSQKPPVLYRKRGNAVKTTGRGNAVKTAGENQNSSHTNLQNLPVKTDDKTLEKCSKFLQLNPEKQKLKKSVLIHLQSIVQSCKDGVPLNRLEKDYRTFIGTNIPFKEFGYDSLEDFIRDIPDVISLKKNINGQIIALGVSDSSTAHLFGQVSKKKSEVSQALNSVKSFPADSAVIKVLTQKNAKPPFFLLPQNASKTDLKNVPKISSSQNHFNYDACQSVDDNAQPVIFKTPQNKTTKSNTQSPAATIFSAPNSKMDNSNTGASKMISNAYPSHQNLKPNISMNLPIQNLHYVSALQNGDSICNIKYQLKKDKGSEVFTEIKVNGVNGMHSNSSNSSFDVSNTQRLSNVLIPPLVQTCSAAPKKLDIVSETSFRSSPADLDFIHPSYINTSVVFNRKSRRRKKKQKNTLSNIHKIQDNTSKVVERSNSQASMNGSQDGLTDTETSDNSCNASESNYPQIKGDITNASLSLILHLHFILFGASNPEILKRHILSFTGFPFCKDSEEWNDKINLLSKLPKKTLKQCLTFLSIPYSTKDAINVLFHKLIKGLEVYTKVPDDEQEKVQELEKKLVNNFTLSSASYAAGASSDCSSVKKSNAVANAKCSTVIKEKSFKSASSSRILDDQCSIEKQYFELERNVETSQIEHSNKKESLRLETSHKSRPKIILKSIKFLPT